MAKNEVNFDFDLLDDAIQNAPTAGYGPQQYFGLLKMTIQVISWTGAKGEQRKINERPYNGKPINKEAGEYLRFTFTSDLSEFNPALVNEYKRRVDVKHSNKTGASETWTLTDFDETFAPSILKVFGSFKKANQALTKGVYAQWQDVSTVEKDKNGNIKGFFKKDRQTGEQTDVFLVNTVPQLLQVFKSKAECGAARAAKYSPRDNNQSVSDDDEIPDNVIADAKGLMQAVSEDQAREIFSNTPPFNVYDVDKLIEAATF